jgi:hypothetical protein
MEPIDYFIRICTSIFHIIVAGILVGLLGSIFCKVRAYLKAICCSILGALLLHVALILLGESSLFDKYYAISLECILGASLGFVTFNSLRKK